MYDSFLVAKGAAERKGSALETFGLKAGQYFLSTIHREATTSSATELIALLDVLGRLDAPVILPMHPRTQACLNQVGFKPTAAGGLRIVDPVGYLEMVQLLLNARKVITDSGGLQKEAYWAGVPCITLMNETTWTETIDAGWNVLVGTDGPRIRAEAQTARPTTGRPEIYGAPGAAARLVESMGWQ
jgi:UDP-GlcNAc3NAcA epimerase